MRNFFAPLRTAEMDLESALMEATSESTASETQQALSSKAGRPPPIILTSSVNLIQLQRNVRDIVKGDFEFRNTKAERESSRRKWRIS
jgi:hypothetical protein